MGRHWQKTLGFFVIPVFFSLIQCWASHHVILQLPPHRITDGVHYVVQGWAFRVFGIHLVRDILLYGLYPAFLSPFKIPGLDWATDGAAPVVVAVYAVQSLILAAATALFLWSSFKFILLSPLKRATTAVLLGGVLISPLVIVWPSGLLMESLTLSALLLFAAACLAFDANKKYSLVLIGLSSCLSILIRDPIIVFSLIFAGMFGLSVLLAQRVRSRAALAGLVTLLVAVGLGGMRSQLTSSSGKYIQPLVNIIQLRILPDPERRAFFFDRGLPMTPTVLERSGKVAQFNNTLFLSDSEVPAEFVAYRNWIVANGFRTYGAFLLTHPGYLLRSIFQSPNIGPPDQYAADFSFSMSDLFSSPMRGYWIDLTPYWPWLRDFLLVPFGWLVPMLYLVIVSMRYVARMMKRKCASSIEVMAIAAIGSIFVSYHADGLDFWRHTVPYVFLIYLSLIARAAAICKDVTQIGLTWSQRWVNRRPENLQMRMGLNEEGP
jgi:hypothetical protein